jgi:hypothetical protein
MNVEWSAFWVWECLCPERSLGVGLNVCILTKQQ